jgi:hypothetical protein
VTGTSLSPTRLPKAGALTEALVAPATQRTSDTPESLRPAVAAALSAAGSTLPRGAHVRVDGYFLRTALTRPERLNHPDPFTWSPRTARRLLGLAAVRACVGGNERTPASAVDRVVSSAVEDGQRENQRAGSLAGWLTSLAVGARAVVRAEAITWATHLLSALDWRGMAEGPIVGSDQWWDGPAGCRVSLRGRSEVRTATLAGDPSCESTTSRTPAAMFTMLGGRPSEVATVELGLVALASFMARPNEPMPARVVGWWPQCGRAMVLSVDSATLRSTTDAVLGAIDTYRQRAA